MASSVSSALALLLLCSPITALNLFGDSASVLKLGVVFNGAGGTTSSIVRQLNKLASNCDPSTADGLADLAHDTSLLLLRRKDTWLACGGSISGFGDEDDAYSAFDKHVIQEAAKFDEEEERLSEGSAAKASPSSPAVVSVIACVAGDRKKAIGANFLGGDAQKMQASLEEVAAAACSDELLAFELLWVPGSEDEALEMDHVNQEWPELLPC